VSFLAALILALNVVCLCPHAAAASEPRAAAAAPAGHCAGAHETPDAPASEAARCPHCDEVGARLSQSGAPADLGASAATLALPLAPSPATLRLPALERALRASASNGGPSPSAQLRTIVLQI
jgi:hypothetical protein